MRASYSSDATGSTETEPLRCRPTPPRGARRRARSTARLRVGGVVSALSMRVAAVIPAYQAERTVGQVVRDATAAWPDDLRGDGAFVFVVDDGSTDATRAR